jgi:hypothetical protein
MLSIAISKFFYVKDPFKKDDEQKKLFLQNPDHLIVKNQLTMQLFSSII